MNAEEAAYSVLTEVALPEIVDQCKRAVEAGAARWLFDPEVANVVGLVKAGTYKRALVVVYLDDKDFEVDDDALESSLA
jgi:hypothetical protein